MDTPFFYAPELLISASSELESAINAIHSLFSSSHSVNAFTILFVATISVWKGNNPSEKLTLQFI